MKNVIFLTCSIFFALCFSTSAQNSAPIILQDTMVIKVKGSNQIHLISQSLTRLSQYKRADSLKSLFITDLRKAFGQPDFQEAPTTLHYLVSAEGKRRLKAVVSNGEESKFDLQYEKKRLQLDLSLYVYTLYDLKEDIQIQFYLEDTSALGLMQNTSINTAIQEIAQEGKQLKKYYKYTLEFQGNHYKVEDKNPHKSEADKANGEFFVIRARDRNTIDVLSAHLNIGASVIGNQLSPAFVTSVYLTFQDKYRKPLTRIGVGNSLFMFTDNSNGLFTSINPCEITRLSFHVNGARKQKNPFWVGMHVGLISDIRHEVIPKKKPVIGYTSSLGSFIFSYEVVVLKAFSKNNLHLFTVTKSLFN